MDTEDDPEERPAFSCWLHDVVEHPLCYGWHVRLSVALTLVVTFSVVAVAAPLLPPGMYSYLELSVPGLIAGGIFFLICAGLIWHMGYWHRKRSPPTSAMDVWRRR